MLEQSIESNTHSISALGAPLAIPQAVWFAGFVIFLLVASVYLLRAMLAFAKGDLRRVRELLGARSVEEEMEFERESLGLSAGRQMTLVAILILLVILVLAIPVAAGLGWLGLVLNQLYSPISLIVTTGEVTWSTTTSFILVAVPFYVLMGEIMLRTGMAERMYAAIAQWVSWLPGGLMHSNVVACAVWGAPSGSSVATAVTVGTVAMGEIKKHKYNEPLFLGTIAAGGTLGILIPPSINMVVYGAMTDTSIPKLYLAGFIPGFVLSILFMADRAVRVPVAARMGRHARRDKLGASASAPCPACCRRWSFSRPSSARSTSAGRPRPKRPRSAFSRPSPTRPTSAACPGR